MRAQIAVKAVVFYKETILLLIRNEKERRYDLPGGGVLPYENPIEGIKREIYEETGLNELGKIQPFHIWDKIKGKLHIVGITFVVKSLSERIILSKEHVAFRWHSIKEIASLRIREDLLQEIMEARKIIESIEENEKN